MLTLGRGGTGLLSPWLCCGLGYEVGCSSGVGVDDGELSTPEIRDHVLVHAEQSKVYSVERISTSWMEKGN